MTKNKKEEFILSEELDDAKAGLTVLYGDLKGVGVTAYNDVKSVLKTGLSLPGELLDQLKNYDEEPKIIEEVYKKYFNVDGTLKERLNTKGVDCDPNAKLALYYYDTYIKYKELLLKEKSNITGLQSEWIDFRKQKELLDSKSLDAQGDFEEINQKITENQRELDSFGDEDEQNELLATLTDEEEKQYITGYINNLKSKIKELEETKYVDTNPKVTCINCENKTLPLDEAIKILENKLKTPLENILDYTLQQARAFYYAKKYNNLYKGK